MTLTSWRVLAAVLGTASAGFIVWAVVRAAVLRRRRAAFLASPAARPLLHFVYTPKEWRRFLRLEGTRYAAMAALLAVVLGAVAFGVRGCASPGATYAGHTAVGLDDPSTLAVLCFTTALALTLAAMLHGHYIAWVLRRTGTVSVFLHGVLIEGKLVDWTRPDTRLVDARVLPDRGLLILEIEEGRDADSATTRIELPLPPGCRPGPALARLVGR